jgi:zinc protease
MLRRVVALIGAIFILTGLVMLVRQYTSARQPQPGNAEAPTGPPPDAGAPLPFDSSITSRTLPNGLKYFVRANNQPGGRAELRLVVNAGSLLEDDDQRGLAHFVEHMAFNGTKRFPKQAIGAFMESIGMRFGPSVNATTSFDETTYSLQIPTDKPDVIDRALMILEDWAHNVTFDPVEVDKERGVIVEEWRLRRGVGARLQDMQAPAFFKGSRYLDRLPIGTPESIRGFKQERLRQFYADWYRPDLMAVIAVGDFDTTAIAKAIERQFGAIPQPAAPRPRPGFDAPALANTEYSISIDKEVPSTNVAILHRRQPHAAVTVGDYRRDIVEQLAVEMLSQRLVDISQLPKGPILSASASRIRSVRALEHVVLSAMASNSGIGPALSALAVERERAVRFGYSEPELDRQKSTLLRTIERAITERAHQPSALLAAEYVRHFTVGEPVPGLQWEYDAVKRLMQTIGVSEVHSAIVAALPEANRVVAVAAPEKTNVYVPPIKELQAVLAAAKDAPMQPWVVRTGTSELMAEPPAPGSIVKTTPHDAVGVTEWTLSNGVRVVLKPTDFKDNQIVFTAVSPGGLSLANDSELVPAQTAAQMVGSMGFGKFASGDILRVLQGRAVGVQPAIGPYEHGLSGGSSREDLETMFQLIHLTMTEPRRDPTIFSALQGQMRTALAGQTGTPEYAFSRELARVLSQDHPRARALEGGSIDQMDLDKSIAFYRQRFGNAAGFTFVFAGSFTVDSIRPLVERYLASLPSTGQAGTWKDNGIRPPRGVVERVVARGIEPKSRTVLVFTGPMEVSREQAIAITAMAEVLQTRLRDAIREELGATYNIAAAASAARVPVGQYSVSIDFTSDPARIEAVTRRVLDELAAFRQNGPTPRQMQDVKAGMERDFESNSRQNAFLAGQIAQRYQTGEPVESVWQMPEMFRALTAQQIHDAARKYLDTNNYIRVTLQPGK